MSHDPIAMVHTVIAALRRARLPVGREEETQARIAEVLRAAGIPFEREHRLTATDRPDFWTSNVAIEVKLRAPKTAIYRQLERYARCPGIAAVLLISATPMGLPREIEGKPAYFLSIGATWL